MLEIDKYLNSALDQRASDIHFSAGEPVRLRVDGDLTILDSTLLENEVMERILLGMLSDAEKAKFHSTQNIDKSYELPGRGFFRVNIFATRRGIAAVLRSIPNKIPTMSQLGLPEAVRQLSDLAKGLVLVTGPTGSGKSTTLAAMINHINETCPYHILTVEDPVEFVHVSKQSLINQREIGSNCPSFADALKYALREDPDVILVGEMRDLETIGLALTAAETGHLVFGTLHTRGAGPSVDRIIDSFPASQQAMIRTMLSESLAGVISQSLIKKADGTGRVAAYEILIVNHAISNLIREGKTFQIPSTMQTARKDGMVLMDQYIIELVDKGTIRAEEAEAYMEDPAPLTSRKGRMAAIQRKAEPQKMADTAQSASNPVRPQTEKPQTMPPLNAAPSLTPSLTSRAPSLAPMSGANKTQTKTTTAPVSSPVAQNAPPLGQPKSQPIKAPPPLGSVPRPSNPPATTTPTPPPMKQAAEEKLEEMGSVDEAAEDPMAAMSLDESSYSEPPKNDDLEAPPPPPEDSDRDAYIDDTPTRLNDSLDPRDSSLWQGGSADSSITALTNALEVISPGLEAEDAKPTSPTASLRSTPEPAAAKAPLAPRPSVVMPASAAKLNVPVTPVKPTSTPVRPSNEAVPATVKTPPVATPVKTDAAPPQPAPPRSSRNLPPPPPPPPGKKAA